MKSEKPVKQIGWLFIYGVILLLSIVLFLSFFPQFSIRIETPQLVLALIIVVLLLFRYFDVIEIPGFLRLNKEIQEVKEETKEIKQMQMNLVQAFAVSQNVSSSNQVLVNPIINQMIKEEGEEAESLLSEPSPTGGDDLHASFEVVKIETDQILQHANRREYSAAFLDMRRYIESLLKIILGHPEKDPLGLSQLIREAQKLRILSPSLYDSLTSIRRVANIFVHMPFSAEADVEESEIYKTIQLGIRVIAELESLKRKIQTQQ